MNPQTNLTNITDTVTIIGQALIGLGILVYTIYKIAAPALAKRAFIPKFKKTVQREACIQALMNETMAGTIERGKSIERLQVYILHNGRTNVLGQCEMAFTCLYETCKAGVLPQKDTLRQMQTADHAWFIRELCINGHALTANKLEEIRQRQARYDSTFSVFARQAVRGLACVPLYRTNEEIMGFVMAHFDEEDQIDQGVIQALCFLSGRLTAHIFSDTPGNRDKGCGPDTPDAPTDTDLLAQLRM